LILRVQSPANFGLVSQMSTLPRSTRINRDIAKAISMVYALRLEGENKKRLLVGRLKIASRRAEMHLLYGTYVVDKHDTGRHCMGDGLFDFSKLAAERSHSFEKISCYFVDIQTPIPSVRSAR
jgi:hypothetical protein